METCKACRICLETNATLYNLHSNSMEIYYKLLTGVDPLKKLNLPMFVCYECAALLKKFYLFRQKSLRGQAILQGMLQSSGKITEEDLQEVDTRKFLLKTNLSIHEAFSVSLGADDPEIEELENMEFENDMIKVEKVSKDSATDASVSSCEIVEEWLSETSSPKHDVEDFDMVDGTTKEEDDKLEEFDESTKMENYEFEPFMCDLCWRGFPDLESWEQHTMSHDEITEKEKKMIAKRRSHLKKKVYVDNDSLKTETSKNENDSSMDDIIRNQLNFNPAKDDPEFEILEEWLSDEDICRETIVKDMKENVEIKQEVVDVIEQPKPKKKMIRKKKNTLLPLQKTLNVPQNIIGNIKLENYATVIVLSHEEQIIDIKKRAETENYLLSPFKCEHCFKGFLDSKTWEKHMVKHDVVSGELECEICRSRFKRQSALNSHRRMHSHKYQCKHCPHVSRYPTQAMHHILWHKGVMYKCPYCDEMQPTSAAYMSHVRIKHPSDHVCGFCGYSFVSQLGLAMHKAIMHKDMDEETEGASEALYCGACDVHFRSEQALRRHRVTARKHAKELGNKHGCRECGLTFPTDAARREHAREHRRAAPRHYARARTHAPASLACPHCPEVLKSSKAYYWHFRRKHADQEYPLKKEFVCHLCGRAFSSGGLLKYHMRAHSGERHVCACGRAFAFAYQRAAHERAHAAGKPLVCELCGRAFADRGALDRHTRIHTGEKPYKCDYCPKAFTQSNSCKLHERTVHLKQKVYTKKRPKVTANN